MSCLHDAIVVAAEVHKLTRSEHIDKITGHLIELAVTCEACGLRLTFNHKSQISLDGLDFRVLVNLQAKPEPSHIITLNKRVLVLQKAKAEVADA